MPRWRRGKAAWVLVWAAAWIVSGPAAASRPQGGPSVVGKIVAISDTSITFELPSGKTVSAPIGPNTEYEVGGRRSALSVVRVGMEGHAFLEGGPAVLVVAYTPMTPASTRPTTKPVKTGPTATRGAVLAIAADRITLKLPGGPTVGFVVNADTVMTLRQREVAWTDVKIGMTAVVTGVQEGAALEVMLSEPAGSEVRGVIKAVADGTITLYTDSAKDLPVTINSATAVRIDGRQGRAADLKCGMRATVAGDPGKAAREIIAVSPLPQVKLLVEGVIQSIGRDSLTVKNKDGKTVEIPVGPATVYKVGAKGTALSDLAAGMRMTAYGVQGQPAAQVHAYMPTR